MSLRDFNSSPDDRPISLNNEPMGNGTGLGSFHTINPEEREPNNTGKIVGALAVALMVGAAGAYIYSVSGTASHPKPIVAANNLPSPAPMPAPQPAADTSAAPAPMPDATPAAAPAPKAAPAPVKTAAAKPARNRIASAPPDSSMSGSGASARMAADSTQVSQQPQQQAAITTTPVEPVSPQAPTSSVASNQPATAAVPSAIAPDVPQPQPQPGTQAQPSTAPAQDEQTGATPAPAPQQ